MYKPCRLQITPDRLLITQARCMVTNTIGSIMPMMSTFTIPLILHVHQIYCSFIEWIMENLVC